jgi:hypothetical protein
MEKGVSVKEQTIASKLYRKTLLGKGNSVVMLPPG